VTIRLQQFRFRRYFLRHWRGPWFPRRLVHRGHDLDDPWADYHPDGTPVIRRRRRRRFAPPALRYLRVTTPEFHSTVIWNQELRTTILVEQNRQLADLAYWRSLATRLAALDVESAVHNWRLGTNVLHIFSERYGPGRNRRGLPKPGTTPHQLLATRGRHLRDLRARIPCRCQWCRIRDGEEDPPFRVPTD